MSHDLCCHKCGSMHHSTQSHDAVEAEERAINEAKEKDG